MGEKEVFASNLQIPDRIYQILPYAYLAAGVFAIFLANNSIAVFSGICLITAGFLVMLARYQNRRVNAIGNHIAKHQVGAKKVDTNSMKIQWRKSLESGHPLIDEQHRKLFTLGNDLINQILNDDTDKMIPLILDNIIKHTEDHFKTEESIMAAIKYPISDTHKEIHQSLLNILNDGSARLKSGDLHPKELIGIVLYDIIKDHLMKEDFDFFEGVKTRVNQIQKTHG